VIHGFIDGYCRTVCYVNTSTASTVLTHFQVTGLHVSTNDRAHTVFEVFMRATDDTVGQKTAPMFVNFRKIDML
jgi:hypothetical protein